MTEEINEAEINKADLTSLIVRLISIYYGLGSIFGSIRSYQQYAYNKRSTGSGFYPINDPEPYLFFLVVHVLLIVVCALVWYKSEKISVKILKGKSISLSVSNIKETSLLIMAIYFVGVHVPSGVFAIFSLIERVKSSSIDSIFLYENFRPNLSIAFLSLIFGYFVLKQKIKLK